MKTIKFLPLFILLILISSCNTARNYANYRVGGKSPKKEIIGKSINDPKRNPTKNATLEMMPAHDTLELKQNKFLVEDSIGLHCHKKEKFVTNDIIRGKIQNMVVGMRIDKDEKTKPSGSNIGVKAKGKSHVKKNKDIKYAALKSTNNSFQNYGVDAEDVLYFILGTLLIIGGVLALIAAGVSLAEIVIFGLGFIGVLILLYLLGEAFMNIFPGMSRKIRKSKWRSVKAHNCNEKEIDWEEVGEVFAGILVILILLGLLVYLIFFSGVTFLEVLMLLLAVGLFILLFYGIWKLFEGFLYMFDN